LAERLERIRSQKERADADMLTLLEELVRDWTGEQEAQAALGLSGRAQAFLSLARMHAPAGSDDELLVDLARHVDEIVGKNATFPEWEERDDVLRDIRREVLELLIGQKETRLLLGTSFVDEALTVAAARGV
jgi:hypothetical protein